MHRFLQDKVNGKPVQDGLLKLKFGAQIEEIKYIRYILFLKCGAISHLWLKI